MDDNTKTINEVSSKFSDELNFIIVYFFLKFTITLPFLNLLKFIFHRLP